MPFSFLPLLLSFLIAATDSQAISAGQELQRSDAANADANLNTALPAYGSSLSAPAATPVVSPSESPPPPPAAPDLPVTPDLGAGL